MKKNQSLHIVIRGILFLSMLFTSAAIGFSQEKEEAQDPAVAQGISLFDRGEYDKAIAKFKESLERNPQNAEALYELAYTYHVKRDFARTLEAAEKALAIPSKLKPIIFLLIGSTHDELGNADKAIAAYRDGIQIDPNFALLHFNMGITLARRRQWTEARQATQSAILLNPFHSSSHYLLAQIYTNEEYRIPSLLAYYQFLMLESPSPRSKKAWAESEKIFQAGVTKNKADGSVSLAVNTHSKTDEGDFNTMELAIPLLQASSDLKKEEKKLDDLGAAVYRITSMIAIMTELKQDKSQGFAMRFYVPFFTALHQKGFTETAAHLILYTAGFTGAGEWLESNRKRVDEFLSWWKKE